MLEIQKIYWYIKYWFIPPLHGSLWLHFCAPPLKANFALGKAKNCQSSAIFPITQPPIYQLILERMAYGNRMRHPSDALRLQNRSAIGNRHGDALLNRTDGILQIILACHMSRLAGKLFSKFCSGPIHCRLGWHYSDMNDNMGLERISQREKWIGCHTKPGESGITEPELNVNTYVVGLNCSMLFLNCFAWPA